MEKVVLGEPDYAAKFAVFFSLRRGRGRGKTDT